MDLLQYAFYLRSFVGWTMKRIGIRREDKNPWERRVPLIPEHAALLVKDGIEVWVQPSPNRAFTDDEFRAAGARVEEDLSSCDPVIAVKEMPAGFFKEGKAYVFFAHVIKGQAYNMPMLRALMDRGCSLFDYEKMVDDAGRRVVFFGEFAGLAGMIDGLWALGQRLEHEGTPNPFSSMKKALDYGSQSEAEAAVRSVGQRIAAEGLPAGLSPLVCGFAGYGNVSRGAQKIWDLLPCREISPEQAAALAAGKPFEADSRAVYKAVFKEEHLVEPVVEGAAFELQDYYKNPRKYRSVFEKYLPALTVLMNCVYWEAKYPRLLTKAYLKETWKGGVPRLRVVGDISCDVEGAAECTLKCTDSGNPVFVYDPATDRALDGVEGAGPVVLAVDNLPAELPKDSSRVFSEALLPHLPCLASADLSREPASSGLSKTLQRALIVHKGALTADFRYLDAHLQKAGIGEG